MVKSFKEGIVEDSIQSAVEGSIFEGFEALKKRPIKAMKRDWALIFRHAMPVLDALLVIVAFGLAYIIRYVWNIIPVVESAEFVSFLPQALLYIFWLLLTGPVAGMYREQRGRTWIEEVSRIANGATSATVLIMALSFLLRPLSFSRLLIIEATVLVIVLLSVERLIYRWLRNKLRAQGIGVEHVLIVGAGEVGRAVLSAIIARPDLGYVPIGYLDDRPERGSVDMGRVRGLGDLDNLNALLEEHAVELVIITLPWSARQKITEIVGECDQHKVVARVVPDLFQLNMSQVRIENLEGIPLLGIRTETRMDRSKYLIKRTLDLVLITLASPLILLIGGLAALAIKLDSPGPVVFKQRRVGRDGREFDVFKFRSMRPDSDKLHADLIRQTGVDPRRPKWQNDPRRTRVGKWLRRTSLDELPQLINVLRGEMSIVGPRPPTPGEVELYEPWQRQRLNTQPGLTCLWQVSGRSKIPFEEQCLLDIYYIENWSIGLEIQILLRTIPNVLMGNGAY